MKNIYAAIDVGSNQMKLKIIQYVQGHMEVIENMSKSVNIGQGVFSHGYIDHDEVREIIETLKFFQESMRGYDVSKYRAVGTSAMRAAENGRNVIEMIFMKTGIEVEILEDTMEKYLTYKSMRDNLPDYKLIRNSAMLVEMNTGSCDISIYNRSGLVFNEEFILGTLVLKNIMQELEMYSSEYPRVINELIVSRTRHIWQSILQKKIKHFMAIGGEVRLMKKHIFNNQEVIDRKTFNKVYTRVIEDHRLYRKEIEALEMDWYEFVSCVLIYYTFFDLLKTDQLLFPEINLRDGMLAEMIEKDYQVTKYQIFRNDTISLARQISKRYKSDINHCRNIELNAIMLYKGLKEQFLFDEEDELLLRVSAVLHEIGKFTRMKDYHLATFQKIQNLNIVGLTHNDMSFIAYVCRFMTGGRFNYDEGLNMDLKVHNRIFKLASIMAIADALDKSKMQKISVERTEIVDERFNIYISKNGETILEEWDFEKRKKDFMNTFGIVPRIIEV